MMARAKAVNQTAEIQPIVVCLVWKQTVARERLRVTGPGHSGESEDTNLSVFTQCCPRKTWRQNLIVVNGSH